MCVGLQVSMLQFAGLYLLLYVLKGLFSSVRKVFFEKCLCNGRLSDSSRVVFRDHFSISVDKLTRRARYDSSNMAPAGEEKSLTNVNANEFKIPAISHYLKWSMSDPVIFRAGEEKIV